jgi:hypothetical protein
MKNVDTFMYYLAIWNILRPSDAYILRPFGNLVYFPHFGLFYKEKSGNPGLEYRLLNPNQTNHLESVKQWRLDILSSYYLDKEVNFLTRVLTNTKKFDQHQKV